MPKHDARRGDDAKRVTLRLSTRTVRRVEEFASRNGISMTKAVDLLASLGLDAELAGAESLIELKQKLIDEMRSMRSLMVAARDNADAATAAVLGHQISAGLIKESGLAQQYIYIRRFLPTFRKLKEQSSASASDLLEGTVE